MGLQRQLREYDLSRLMLKDRQLLHAEYVRVAGLRGAEELQAITDREKIRTILSIEFPATKREGRRR